MLTSLWSTVNQAALSSTDAPLGFNDAFVSATYSASMPCAQYAVDRSNRIYPDSS